MNQITAERRSGTQEMVNKLLSERQEMLVLFCKLAGLQPVPHESREQDLQRFCEVLVDYSAFGHFEIYERIIDGRERRGEVVKVASDVYSRIAETTEFAVAFNDKYDSNDHPLDLHRLDNDLSNMGEELAVRIELEDRIIDALVDTR